jgi:hypothetical protein
VPDPTENTHAPVETSSTPPLLPEKQEALFREVLEVLVGLSIPFAVSGAFALQEHTGICRFTKDLDVFLPAKYVSQALRSLEDRGFKCETCDAVWLAKAHRDDFFVDLITGMSNAVIVVEDSWIQNAKPADVMGVSVKVLAPAELIASKLFVSRRERFDGADIAHVIYGTQGHLDWDRVLELVGEHWEILLWSLLLFHYVYPAHKDYVPERIWRELLSRLNHTLAHPDAGAPFRGSLVDDNMFAIDVNEWGLENLLREYRERRLRKLEAPAA